MEDAVEVVVRWTFGLRPRRGLVVPSAATAAVVGVTNAFEVFRHLEACEGTGSDDGVGSIIACPGGFESSRSNLSCT